MSSWWQTKLLPYGLRYILSKTGILEEKVQDIANFNISVGKRNVIELKYVGLNIAQLSKYAKLPPCVRIETARILLLRLTVPADIFQSSIVVEVDGVELIAVLEDEAVPSKVRERSPTSTKTPQHRKTDRRLRSPPLHDPGGASKADCDAHIPTTQEVAKSFLMEEPLQERRELEASVAATSKDLEESFVSQSSDSDDVGTGVSIGVPGFLASFLQGLVDRLRVEVKNVQVKLETEVQSDAAEPLPITLSLRVSSVVVDPLSAPQAEGRQDPEAGRQIKIRGIDVNLLANAEAFADMSEVPSQSSQSGSRHTGHQSVASQDSSPPYDPAPESPIPSSPSVASIASTVQSAADPPAEYMNPVGLAASVSTVDADRFADAGDEDESATPFDPPDHSEHDIRMGDDNISWGSRRSHSSAPRDDLWESMVSEEHPAASTGSELGRMFNSQAYSSRSNSPDATRLRRPPSSLQRVSRVTSDRLQTSRSSQDEDPRLFPNIHSRSLTNQSFTDRSPDFHRRDHAYPSRARQSHAHHSVHSEVPEEFVNAHADTTFLDHASVPVKQSTIGDAEKTPYGTPESDNGLAESQLFDPETAKSLYLSAVTSSPKMQIPGAWDDHSQLDPSPARVHTNDDSASLETSRDGAHDIEVSAPGNETPRAQTPIQKQGFGKVNTARSLQASKRLLNIDAITLLMPLSKPSGEAPPSSFDEESTTRSGFSGGKHTIPGTFSAYSERSSSLYRESGPVRKYERNLPRISSERPQSPGVNSPLSITLDTVFVQLDVSAVRLLCCAAVKATSALQQPRHGQQTSEQGSNSNSPSMSMKLQLQSLRLSLTEKLGVDREPEMPLVPSGREVLVLVLEGLSLLHAAATRLRIASASFLLGTHELLVFHPDATQSYGAGTRTIPSILVNVEGDKFSADLRRIIEIHVETAPVHLMLDLSVLEDTFSPFGGLSSILEMGSSILSESGASSPIHSPKPSKGVRFASDRDTVQPQSELKCNISIAAVEAALHGPCSVTLQTSKLRAVYRENGNSVTIDRIALYALHQTTQKDAPISVELTGLRLEYVSAPPERDIERLLSLLTPSKDTYDNDDDILVGTLARQRRKGGLLRVALADVNVRVNDWDRISQLDLLGQELSKLSVVAKYLPEDDRPGLLTLARLTRVEVLVPVNDRFGKLQVCARNLNLAHVGLPALLAFSIETIHARRPGAADLLHPLNPVPSADVLPMIMGRMLGGEEVPTVKIKLFNVCLEYSVPIVIALASTHEETSAEDLVTDVVQSVANLALAGDLSPSPQRTSSGLSTSSPKPMAIDLLLHHSGVGLNPQHLASKALLALSDVHVSTTVPPGEVARAQINLRRAELYVADEVAHQADESTLSSSVRLLPTADPAQRLSTHLTQTGYVAIGSLRSAEIQIKSQADASGDPPSVEVTVRNELFLLETCADSTQTMIATFGALAPPAPPSKQPKYLTEPVTIEDMMASFTGEPVDQTENLPETLFDADADNEPDDEPEFLFDAQDSDQEGLGDPMAESQMTSSMYNPASGLLGVADDEAEGSAGDFEETAESLLEDDPFEMTISPTDAPMSDQELLRDLRKQCRPALNEEPVDLGICEVEDLGFDALGSGQQALGIINRFSAPYPGKSGKRLDNAPPKLPFSLKLRDFHVIWHLYDGYDWERTRQGIEDIVEKVERKAEERKARRRHSFNDQEVESVIGDILFNSIYIGVPADTDPHELRQRINQGIDEQVSMTESVPLSGTSRPTNLSGPGQPRRPRPRRRLKIARSRSHKISFELKGVSADVSIYPPGSGTTLSTTDLRVKHCDIFDNVPTSTWRKFLTHLSDDREMSKPMFHIFLENVKTLESHSASELTLEMSVLPLRLHVDQDALDFITRFFEFKDKSMIPDEVPAEPPFIQRLEVHTVDMCLDYKPKRLDYGGLRSGRTSEFMNFVTLDASNIRLNHAIVYGLRGFDVIHPTLNAIWLPDIQRNQLPTVLAGVAAVRSLANVASGFRDVITIPVKEYKKDGRIVRSIQKGALQFGKTTSSELARLGAKLALGTQTLLTTTEGFLSPAAASTSGRPSSMRRISSEQGWHDVSQDDNDEGQRAVSAYANQPRGVLAGFNSARRHLEHDLLTARDALIAVQTEMLDSSGPSEVAAAVVKHAPTVILRPVIGATRAVGTTLLGVGNQIDKSNMRRIDDKYKRR